MRGDDRSQGAMFNYVSLEHRIPVDNPLRPIRELVDEVLRELSPRFQRLYASHGRPSIPPERLLRALVIQILYSVRSERMLMEQLEYNLLFHWFVGLGIEDRVWVATVFTKNRDRQLDGVIAQSFFEVVLGQAQSQRLLSSEHFTVDGTLIEAWASHKSFKPKGKKRRKDSDDDPDNPTINFRGERRTNATHESTTDPESRLAKKKGQPSRLSYLGHLLTENRHGLAVGARLTQADGYAVREAALDMLGALPEGDRITLGADKGYDAQDFVEGCRDLGVTPDVSQNTTNRSSRIDARTTRHACYEVSQHKRKQIEEVFGWMKTVGLMRKTRRNDRRRVGWMFVFKAAVYNLVRIRNLAGAT